MISVLWYVITYDVMCYRWCFHHKLFLDSAIPSFSSTKVYSKRLVGINYSSVSFSLHVPLFWAFSSAFVNVTRISKFFETILLRLGEHARAWSFGNLIASFQAVSFVSMPSSLCFCENVLADRILCTSGATSITWWYVNWKFRSTDTISHKSWV